MKKPKIRFKGFNDDWEQRKLSKYATFLSGNGLRWDDIDDTGVQECILYGNLYTDYGMMTDTIKYRTNSIPQNPVYSKEGDVLIPASDTTPTGLARATSLEKSGVLLGGDINIVRPNKDINGSCLSLALNANKDQMIRLIKGTTVRHIHNSDIQNIDITLPNYKIEQFKIASYFKVIDNIITLHQRKCDEIKKLKKYMLQNMFPQNDEKVPKIRFDGFTDDWEQRKVSDVAEIIAGGTPKTSVLEYWNPKEVPWLSSGEVHKKYITYTDDKISKKGLDHSSAKIIKENSVLIALAGQGKTRGTVAINRIPLSTNQSIAAMIFNDNIVPEFIFSNLDNRYNELRRISSGDGSRGGLNKLLIGNIIIPYTDKLEQDKIGQFFSLLDHLITLHQRKCDELKNMKKFMLQNMFV